MIYTYKVKGGFGETRTWASIINWACWDGICKQNNPEPEPEDELFEIVVTIEV